MHAEDALHSEGVHRIDQRKLCCSHWNVPTVDMGDGLRGQGERARAYRIQPFSCVHFESLPAVGTHALAASTSVARIGLSAACSCSDARHRQRMLAAALPGN